MNSSSLGALPPCPRDFYRIPRQKDGSARQINEKARPPLIPPLIGARCCVPAVPYPPLRSFQVDHRNPLGIIIKNARTPLTSCLTQGFISKRIFFGRNLDIQDQNARLAHENATTPPI